jgi:quercetin dioxygenase-like cupin family protein
VDDPPTLWCDDLDQAIRALQRLGMRLMVIGPADAPKVAEMSGMGLRLRLERRPGAPAAPAGRAGMVYRDALPGRAGGRLIASHITIGDGGPVPDYVHHHDVTFQIVHCLRGWVRVVYEDQGPPFVVEAGDTVLQPPHIRHRVLESSPGLEVLEVTSPAEHPTFADHVITLPTAAVQPGRRFSGQRFVRHQLASAEWLPWRAAGFEAAETGIGAATGDVVDARTVRIADPGAVIPPSSQDVASTTLWYVEAGSANLHLDGVARRLSAPDATTLPVGVVRSLDECSADLRLYEVVASS